MNYPFSYKVKIWDYKGEKKVYETGLGMCESFADAASKIENYYRSEIIAIEKLEPFEQSSLIVLPENICKQCVEELRKGCE